MSNRYKSIFYGLLIAATSLVVGMVVTARLDLVPGSWARTPTMPVASTAPLTGALDASTFRTVAHDQSPSVVTILTTARRPVEPTGFEQFFSQQQRRGQRQQAPMQVMQGAGSGFIIDKAGFILTNNHVVADADDIRVRLFTADEFDKGLPAKVIGRDPLTDSALIQLTELPREPLQEAKFGDSSQMEPGDWVMAIGNPFNFNHSVTVGVVSAVGRVKSELSPIPQRDIEFIQTDAAINRGNSGGPLLNVRGEVIGINTAIVSDDAGGNIGIGFAVPINTVREVLPQLRSGKIIRGRIGVSVDKRPMTDVDVADYGLSSRMGAIVVGVDDKGPAGAAGIRNFDVITEFNGKAVKDSADLVNMVVHTAPNMTVPVKIMRDKKPQTLSVKVEELDLVSEQQASGLQAPTPNPTPAEPKDAGLGMTLQDLTTAQRNRLQLPKGQTGVVVTDIDPLSPAGESGLAPGNIILSVNGRAVSSVDEAKAALDQIRPGQAARMVVWQGGREVGVTVRKR
jgi:serine protease Do